MAWSDGFPSASEVPDSRLASLLTTQKIAFRQAIEKHSFWTDSSGASAGWTRLSDGSFGPGSCRAYFAPVSSLSTGETAWKPMTGRLYVTSDTSRLYTWVGSIASYGFTAAETLLLVGSKRAITWQTGSQVTMQNNARVLVQCGTANLTVGSNTTVAFDIAYAAVAPAIQLQAMSSTTTAMAIPTIVSSSTSNFALSGLTVYGTTSVFSIMWRSHGTVSL